MSICYICGCKITESNTYREHIILNSIGGKLISPSIICSSCAPSLDVLDTALSKQLNSVGLMLNIKRDRGQNQHIIAKVIETGEDIFLSAGGKPILIKPTIRENQNDGSISITARNEKQLRECLKGLQRNYPFIKDKDIDTIINNADKNENFFDKAVSYNQTIGGEETFRSICKMIVSFYMYNGGTREQIQHLIPYIKYGCQQNFVCYYYPDEFLNLNKEPIQILHRLFVKANSIEKIMYGYVELFSTFKFLVLMSENYTGRDFQKSYCFDVLSRSPVKSTINLNLPRETALKVIELKENKLDEFKDALNRLMALIKKKQVDTCISNIIQKNIEISFQNITEGSVANEETIRAFIENLSKVLAEFMYSQSRAYQDYPHNIE